MTSESTSSDGPPLVHALLICRNVTKDASGEISIENVLEIIPVEEVPAEVGPLTFVALVRNLPHGPGQGAFILRPMGSDEVLGRLPFETEVPPGYHGRQVALQVSLPKLPVKSGGWFEVVFEWEGSMLAVNCFAIGVMG